MKVLLINGSPRNGSCVHTALSEIASTLETEGVQSEIFWIGNKPVQGCTACFQCRTGSKDGCVFKDELYTSLVSKLKECDGIIIGSPVYYAGPAGSLCAILDRVFFSAGPCLRGKPAACVVNARRGGCSSAFDRLNKYFTLMQMPVVSSTYWNSTHGTTPDEVKLDLEGMQVMRNLARSMAEMLKNYDASKVPAAEKKVSTNFIREIAD